MKPPCRLFIFLIYFCCLASCKKNIVSSEPIQPFKASFTIAEKFYGFSRLLDTDTVVTFQAFFEADDFYESYRWQVGDDPTIRTSKSFSLFFPESIAGKTLQVQLVATKHKQIDTVTRHFTVMALKGTVWENVTPFSITLPLLGKFEGAYDDAPNHKFVIQVVNFGDNANSGFIGFRLGNLPEGCGAKYISGQPCVLGQMNTATYSYGMQVSYKGFFIEEGDDIGCCPPVAFLGYLDNINKNKIIVECYFKNNSNPQLNFSRRFTGYRLP